MNIINVNLKGQEKATGHNNPNKIIIHHPEYYGSVEGLNDVMRNMGFYMIGYNYYVRKDGSVYQGRPDWAQSANCYNQNTQSLGVCFEGDYDKDASMPQAQFDAGVELIKHLKSKYGINEVNGHKAYYNTACPGVNFPLTAMLNAIKNGGSSSSSSETTVYKAAQVVGVSSYLNVRDGASTNSNVIGKVFADEIVHIKWTEPGWHYIIYNTSHGTKEGYVYAKYIKEL